MRIAFLTDKSVPFFVGGYETRVYELARRLATHNEVRVFTSLNQPTAVVEGVRFERVAPLTFQRDASGARSLAHSTLFSVALLVDHLTEFDPDVLVVEAIPYLHLALMRGWVRHARAVLLVDVLEAWDRFAYTDLPILGLLSRTTIRHCLATGLRWADGALAISGATANSLITNYGVDPDKVSVIPLGLTASPTRPAAGESAAEYDVITVSRLVGSKRIEDLVQALGCLKDDHGWTGRAVIVGSGPLRAPLEEDVRRRGLESQVRFSGFVTDSVRAQLLSRSRVFVLPSEREGFSLATLEAMGEGVPAVVARPGLDEVFGPGDFIRDGVNGMVYPVGNPTELADRILVLLTQPNLRNRFSASARESAADYSWDTITSRLEALMETLRLRKDSRLPPAS